MRLNNTNFDACRLVLCFSLACFVSFAGCDFTPSPHGLVSNIVHQEHPQLVNGEFDWGSEVAFDVTNTSARGTIHVTVTLSSSEGQWNRSQDLLFEKGQTMHLIYFFQEPTINATNYQAVVHVEP